MGAGLGAGWTRRRFAVLGMLVCAGLGTGVTVAVQAAASGGRQAASGPSVPSVPKPGEHQAARPMASAQVAPAVAATNVHCGQLVTASVTMNGDLSCSGAALVITGTAVNLNLNGHAITSTNYGVGIGVEVRGTSDTVQNGVITGFATGVYLHGTTDTVTKIRATRNSTYGIEEAGVKTKITSNVTFGNAYGIIANGSGPLTVSGNRSTSNTYWGLYIYGPGALISTNIANSNGYAGIYEGGYGATLTGNIANFNHLDGIDVDDAAAIDGGSNTAKGNGYGTANSLVQCFDIVCT